MDFSAFSNSKIVLVLCSNGNILLSKPFATVPSVETIATINTAAFVPRSIEFSRNVGTVDGVGEYFVAVAVVDPNANGPYIFELGPLECSPPFLVVNVQ